MRLIRTLLFAAAALLPPATLLAAPEEPAPLPSEVRLSEAEKEKVLEAAAASRRDDAANHQQDGALSDRLPPQIHGEVGFEVGTGGYRSAYGTAIVPLDDGVAIISLGTTDLGSGHRHPRWR